MSESGKNKRILIMAGGTGGHVYPALSIARCLSERGVDVQWLGTRAGLEAEAVPRAGFPIHYIRVSGLRGKSLVRKLLSPLVILAAVGQSLWRLASLRPHCVLGMGGFATGPGGLAAWLSGRPLLIHEQNAIAGFTNQLLFPLARTVMEAFPGAFDRKRELNDGLLKGLIRPGKAIAVGNPVREEIKGLAPPEQRLAGRQGPLRLLVLGGSLGALALNRLVPAAVALLEPAERPQVRHQCGRRHLDETRRGYREAGLEGAGGIQVKEFIDDMAEAYGWADLVICRAGAITVAELACAGAASILVPFPFAVDDHQSHNARVLEQAGAALLVQQRDLDREKLAAMLRRFRGGRGECLRMARAARALAQPRAAQLAAEHCLEACHA